MLKINRKVEYALMVLKYMSDKNQLVSAREICDQFDTPFDTTAKVMQSMSAKGILTSVKGVKGGHRLSKDLSTISYMELARTVEGKETAVVCQSGKQCSISSCNIMGPIKRLSLIVHNHLEDLTLEELLLDDSKNSFKEEIKDK